MSSNLDRGDFPMATAADAPPGQVPVRPVPPTARRIPRERTHHGDTVVDEYAWLAGKDDPETIAYLEAENAYTAAMTEKLKPFEDTLYKEMLGRIKQTDLDVPVRRGDYLSILPMLPELRRSAKAEANALSGEFSSAETLLDLAGTAELLRRHNLMP